MMMTKQAELKQQAYESDLKSRALSVLIYLIDRTGKDLTCFPAISTMADQLHISISTVKRALHELVEAGCIKRDSRYRGNHGQTSNLYTLVLREHDSCSGKAQDARQESVCQGADQEIERTGSGDKNECKGSGIIECVTFETLKMEMQRENADAECCGAEASPLEQREPQSKRRCGLQKRCRGVVKTRAQVPTMVNRKRIVAVKVSFGWTGEGFNLPPPGTTQIKRRKSVENQYEKP